jgi:hypothetical protein
MTITDVLAEPPEISEEELEEYERECRANVTKRIPAREAEWRAHGAIWSWIDREPSWAKARDLWSIMGCLPDPEEPCDRVFRLCLIGGGQIRVKESFYKWSYTHEGRIDEYLNSHNPKISVIPHLEDGVIRATGLLESTDCYEMDQSAVVLTHGGDQELADRVAATFLLINEPDDFFALLDGSIGCAICGKPLHDEVSKLLNIGPVCARLLIPAMSPGHSGIMSLAVPT